MQPEDVIRLRHMLDAAEEAAGFCAGMTPEQFQADARTWRAVLNCLQVIGEAANRLAEESRCELADVPWRPIIRMRHRLVHAYFDVNVELLWRVVQDDLPTLIAQLRGHLGL